jgi:L-cysteine desulfidase
MNSKVYHEYIKILKEELVPALGCTEPIAVAYASAEARKILGQFPEHIQVKCSGNIIKNVKSVIVPGTGNMKGIDTSAVLGAIAGNPEEKMELLKNVTPEDIKKTINELKKI